jgi:hypothetical protein
MRICKYVEDTVELFDKTYFVSLTFSVTTGKNKSEHFGTPAAESYTEVVIDNIDVRDEFGNIVKGKLRDKIEDIMEERVEQYASEI